MTTDAGSLERNLGLAIELPEGWRRLYRETIHAIAVIDPHARVVQTKEKFGELRIYMKAFSEPIFALIDAASAESRNICQMCGEPGVLSKTADSFYATVCEGHGAGFAPITESRFRHVRLQLPAKDRTSW